MFMNVSILPTSVAVEQKIYLHLTRRCIWQKDIRSLLVIRSTMEEENPRFNNTLCMYI